MKKFTSALLAVTALTAANVFAAGAVDSKTGAYVGGNVGMANTNVKYVMLLAVVVRLLHQQQNLITGLVKLVKRIQYLDCLLVMVCKLVLCTSVVKCMVVLIRQK